MSRARLYTSLPLSAFAAALLIGTAPAAWAQCQAQAGGSMVEDMSTAQQQGGSGSAATGSAVTTAQPGQGDTASAGTGQQGDTAMAEGSGVATDQGGATTDQSGNVTAQSGGGTSGGASAEQGASASGQATAAQDSAEIQGADEERVKSMLEEQGYSEVSSIYSCGAYYEAQAMKDGQEMTLQIDMATGRINPL